jgi:succinoglycan biosynthesis protein ExoA
VFLEKLVVSLQQSSPADKIHIVIVDGCSTDNTPQIAQGLAQRFSNVSLLLNPKKLQAAALNLAASVYGIKAEFLIRIDAHADYPANYCRTLVDEAETTQAASVVVAMRTVGTMPFQKGVAAAQSSRLGNGGSAHRSTINKGRWVDHGHHALMRMDAFRAVGGYDESFKSNEDAELDYRLRQKGYKIWLTGKTSIIYYPRAMPAELFQQYINYGFGRARTLLKHRMRPKLRQLLPACAVPLFLLALATPWLWWACLPLLVWLVFCLGYGTCLAYCAKDTAVNWSGPAAMLMHAGWSLGFWQAVLTTRWR